ncbi:MAG: ABC transporter permease [Clostridia bacterium]|nr:ABC transporter permease [Clostridia bacterium]
MKNWLYLRIAASNVKKNTRLYIPRILAESGLLGCFYILMTLSLDKRLSDALGGAYLPTFMAFGAFVIGFLSFVLILYVNGFLMKRRKSEYGLYNVLGMEKRHIIKVLFCESFISSLVSILIGIAFGVLLYKFSSLLICRLLRKEIVAGFYYINIRTIIAPALIFACLDLFAFLVNCVGICRMKPVELMAEKHTGEKEPKIRWIIFILGTVCLAGGYYISLTVESPLEAILLFFGAVILVIVGTYFLFTAGTTFVLKTLKNNKKYYYNKKHMPAVSGLLFRMKRNAVGLASIAVLATGVLVMISTTVSLYSGVEDTVNAHYPQHLYLSAYTANGGERLPVPADDIEKTVRSAADKYGFRIESVEKERMLSVSYLMRGNKLLTKTEVYGGYDMEELTEAVFITEDTYLQLQSKNDSLTRQNGIGLGKDEIAFCRITGSIADFGRAPDTLVIGVKDYKVKEQFEVFPISTNYGAIVNSIGIVVSDEEAINEIYIAQKEAYGDFASEYADRIGVTFADEKAVSAIGEEFDKSVTAKLENDNPGDLEYSLDTKWASLNNLLEMYGTFLFLGILLGLVCMFSTVLIIYYKQISEGYEDRDRFQIMEKVGMETGEVKKTIGSQLMLQLFLPLITAGIHTAFAFPILLKLLNILMLSNTTLFVLCTLVTFAVFAVIYGMIYTLTARTYYRIVHY